MPNSSSERGIGLAFAVNYVTFTDISAPFSAIIIVGALVLPDVMKGITDASITRKCDVPMTLQAGIHHAAHRCRADGVEDRGADLARRALQRFLALIVWSGPHFLRGIAGKGRLGDDPAGDADSLGGSLPVAFGGQVVGRIAGASAGSVLRIAVRPRLSGRRLQTLAVKAGKGSRSPPKAARLSGWTWYSRSAVARRGSLFRNMPSWLGAIAIGPVRRSMYSSPISALPSRFHARWLSVETPDTCHAQRSCR